jgi:hypothetical protein
VCQDDKVPTDSEKTEPTDRQKLESDLAKHWELVSDTFTGWASKYADVSGSAEKLTFAEWVGASAEVAGRMSALWLEGFALVARHTFSRAADGAKNASDNEPVDGETQH